MYSDSHCHLDAVSEGQRPRVMAQAAAEGVVLMLTTGIDLATSRQGVRVAREYPSVYAGIGYHPSRAVPAPEIPYRELGELAGSERVLAVSEIGLDFSWPGAPDRETQECCFRRHVQLATELSLPVQLHVGGAHREAYRILQEENAFRLGGAIHEQVLTEADLEVWLPTGFYLTVGMTVLQTGADSEELARVVRRIPDDRLLLETDTYSDPGEGELVGPARVKLVAARVAAIRGTTPEELGRMTTSNLRRFLGLTG